MTSVVPRRVKGLQGPSELRSRSTLENVRLVLSLVSVSMTRPFGTPPIIVLIGPRLLSPIVVPSIALLRLT